MRRSTGKNSSQNNSGGLDQMVGSIEGNGKQPDSRSILKAEMTRFPDRLNAGCERVGGR